MKYSTALLFCTLVFSLHAQDAVRDLKLYFEAVREHGNAPLDQRIFKDVRNDRVIVNTLISYLSDPHQQVSLRAIDLLARVGTKSAKQAVRSAAAHQLVSVVGNKDVGRSAYASQQIQAFQVADFSNEDTDSIVSYIQPRQVNLDLILLLAGRIGTPAARERIQHFLIQPASPKLKWSARLALSRMADERATAFILDELADKPKDDAFVSTVVPGLVYSRNKEIFDVLVQIVRSDEPLCLSSNPDSQKSVTCAYRVLGLIAPAIENFPLQADEHGDLKTSNFAEALALAKNWFEENPDYKLIKD